MLARRPVRAVDRLRLLDHDVRVGAADAERADAGAPRPLLGAGPRGQLGDDLDPLAGPVELRIGLLEVDGRRDDLVMQRQGGLDEPGDAGRAVEVSHVGLRGADAGDPGTVHVEHLLQRRDLRRVAQRGAGAVGLHVVDVGRRQPGGGEGLGDDAGLPAHARRGEADLVGAVVVDRPAADHRVHPVAVGERVLEAAQHDHPDAVADRGALPRTRRTPGTARPATPSRPARRRSRPSAAPRSPCRRRAPRRTRR